MPISLIPIMIVQLKHPHPDYPDLTAGQRYLVIGIEADDDRLLSDRGQPCLYPHDLFTILDATRPADRHAETGDDGEEYAYPRALNAPGFFEGFFDGKPDAVQTIWHTINHTLTAA